LNVRVQGAAAPLAFSISISIGEQCTSFPARIPASSTRPIGGGARQQEESMFKMTKDDLAKKTDAHLAALFQEASKGLVVGKPDLASAQSLLAMIRAEIARRDPRP
jgi:hypothetical protein